VNIINKLKVLSIAIFYFFGLYSEIQCMDGDDSDENPFFSETSTSTDSAKYEMKIIKKTDYWCTKPYRPDPTTVKSNNLEYNSKSTSMYGGAIIWEDKRTFVQNTKEDRWQVHGQLSMDFNGSRYSGTGTLISPWHVLTAGHNLYDPNEKVWAKDVKFYPGRNGKTILGVSAPVSVVRLGVSFKWGQGDRTWDMGIIELETDVGNKVGWNGLLAGNDNFIKSLPSICVAGYPGDKKPKNTMWMGTGDITDVKEKQFSYKLSTNSGQSGSNPFIKSSHGNFYSLGIHSYGQKDVANTATRLTFDRLSALVNIINEGIQ
jgi:V8-like Glu-specific endopeptidase